jgi:hypothetical protein
MAVASVQKSINASTPTLLVQADTDGCIVYLHTQVTIWVGGATVSSSTGMRLDSQAGPLEIRLQPTDALYAVSNSGTQTVTLMTVGN